MPKVQIPSQTGVLERVSVRLLFPEERERLDQLLEQEDYLHSARLGGQSLRYVAELDGQWVALLSFSAPALQIKAREKWLGWTPRQRARRLCTSGFGRASRDFYVEHGQPKELYLRELEKGAASLLRRGRLPARLAEYEEWRREFAAA